MSEITKRGHGILADNIEGARTTSTRGLPDLRWYGVSMETAKLQQAWQITVFSTVGFAQSVTIEWRDVPLEQPAWLKEKTGNAADQS